MVIEYLSDMLSTLDGMSQIHHCFAPHIIIYVSAKWS